MREQPDVSVIVATRNRAAYLDVALASITAQRCDAPFELVVVDNGSTDGTPAVLERWCRENRCLRIVRESQPGLSRAKNAGVAAATGRVLVFTDDDVVTQPGWLAALVEKVDEHSAGLVVVGGKIVPVPDDLGPWPAWFGDAALPEAGMLDLAEEQPVAPPQYVWGASMAVRSELFERLGPWNEDVGRRADQRGTFEDTELQDRVRAAGGSVWFCPAAVLEHRIPRSTLTRRDIVLRAFARGGYDRRMQQLRGAATSAPASPVSLGAAIIAALGMIAWEVVFRVAPKRPVFRRLHHAAWNAGRRLEDVEARDRAGAADDGSHSKGRAVRRAVWISRRLIKDRN